MFQLWKSTFLMLNLAFQNTKRDAALGSLYDISKDLKVQSIIKDLKVKRIYNHLNLLELIKTRLWKKHTKLLFWINASKDSKVENVSKDLKVKMITLVEVQEEDQVDVRPVMSCISLY